MGQGLINDELSPLFFRYGVEPPVLVKLEKEIELEETLLNTSGLEDSISIPKSCCQHEELDEAVTPLFCSKDENVIIYHSLKENISCLRFIPILISSPQWVAY